MTNNFIGVTAIPCNQSGIKTTMKIPVDFLLNISLIKVIQNNSVFVGGNEVLSFGGSHYTSIRLKK
jgi:hypothetical protein